MRMTDTQRRELLKDEYLLLEKAIQEFDGRALTIKGWSVTFSLAALAGAFVSHAAPVFLIATFGSCLFWLIEGMWKSFQYGFYERMNEIEAFFAGENAKVIPLQTGRSWYRRWSGLGARKMLCILTWPHVALPHLVVVLIGVVLFVCASAGLIAP
jgi:hypothetical protein